jgi:hypothetical protein
MYIFIENPRTAVSIHAIFLLASLIIPPQLHAQDEQSVTPTFEETHALITKLILDKQILQNHWHQMDFPQYNHFDDAVWSITMYSGDECEITYRRKFEISHKSQESVKPVYGDKPATIIGHKTAKFDMANIETIEIHDFGDSRGSIPSVGIRFVVPTAEWQTIGRKPKKADLSKDPVIKEDNAISVSAKDSKRVLEAFQHVQALCQTADDEQP